MASGHITTFSRFFFAAPMLYIGLRMTVDPGCLDRWAAVVSGALRAFERQLHGLNRQFRFGEDPVPMSDRAKRFTRIAGTIVAACAFLVVAGLVH